MSSCGEVFACEAGEESPRLDDLVGGEVFSFTFTWCPLGGALNTFVFTFGVKYITLCDVGAFKDHLIPPSRIIFWTLQL